MASKKIVYNQTTKFVLHLFSHLGWQMSMIKLTKYLKGMKSKISQKRLIHKILAYVQAIVQQCVAAVLEMRTYSNHSYLIDDVSQPFPNHMLTAFCYER